MMDTAHVAEQLKTTPRLLRQFLRSPGSTFVSVGSGARYEFTMADMPMLAKRFNEWRTNGKSRVVTPTPKASRPVTSAVSWITEKDRKVWQEEGPVALEDIRDPRVKARVKRDAQAAEDRLQMMLLATGLHITQLGDRKAS